MCGGVEFFCRFDVVRGGIELEHRECQHREGGEYSFVHTFRTVFDRPFRSAAPAAPAFGSQRDMEQFCSRKRHFELASKCLPPRWSGENLFAGYLAQALKNNEIFGSRQTKKRRNFLWFLCDEGVARCDSSPFSMVTGDFG